MAGELEHKNYKRVGGLRLLVQEIGYVLCRCEFIRTRPNEFGPTARIRRRDLNGYHYVGPDSGKRGVSPFLAAVSCLNAAIPRPGNNAQLRLPP